MSEKSDWMLEQLNQIYKQADFKSKAFIKVAQDVIKEQDKRIWQMEGELDGTLWSPKNWYD